MSLSLLNLSVRTELTTNNLPILCFYAQITNPVYIPINQVHNLKVRYFGVFIFTQHTRLRAQALEEQFPLNYYVECGRLRRFYVRYRRTLLPTR